MKSPEELANSVAFLPIDLSDPEFRAPALAQSRHVRDGYEAFLHDAIVGPLRSRRR